MKHKFTVIIDVEDEDRESTHGQLESWLDLCMRVKRIQSSYPDWNSIEVTD